MELQNDIKTLSDVMESKLTGRDKDFFWALVKGIRNSDLPSLEELEKLADNQTSELRSKIENLKNDLAKLDKLELSPESLAPMANALTEQIDKTEDLLGKSLDSAIAMALIDKYGESYIKGTSSTTGSTSKGYWYKYDNKFALFTGYKNETHEKTNGRSLYLVMSEALSDDQWAKVKGAESWEAEHLHLVAFDGKKAEYIANLGLAKSPNGAIQKTMDWLEIDAKNVGLHPSTWADDNDHQQTAMATWPKVLASLTS